MSFARPIPAIVYVILWMTAVVTPLYWIAFFATGNLTPSPTDIGLRFEMAFPAADMWMAVAAALGAIGLKRGWALGYPMAIAAAGSMLYLALMDVTFDLENGVYMLERGQVAIEIAINVFCLGAAAVLFGVLLARAPKPNSAARHPEQRLPE